MYINIEYIEEPHSLCHKFKSERLVHDIEVLSPKISVLSVTYEYGSIIYFDYLE